MDHDTKDRDGADAQIRIRTIADLAEIAGVSRSTVSRALAHSPLISAQTGDRVRALAREHQFTVNAAARSLRLKQTMTLQAVVPWIAPGSRQHATDPFLLSLLAAIADATAAAGYDLLLSTATPWSGGQGAHALETGRADGIIIIGQDQSHQAIADLAARHDPVVVWGAPVAGEPYCLVGTDGRTGGRLAAEHLLARGRERLAVLADPGDPEAAQRLAGVRDALSAAGLTLDPGLIVPAGFDGASAERAAQALVRLGAAFDGVFAASDILAMTVVRALGEAGRRVPEDVSVVGFDDIAPARSFTPPLTTIRQDIARGGALLVERLLGRMAGEAVSTTLLPPDLVVRDT